MKEEPQTYTQTPEVQMPNNFNTLLRLGLYTGAAYALCRTIFSARTEEVPGQPDKLKVVSEPGDETAIAQLDLRQVIPPDVLDKPFIRWQAEDYRDKINARRQQIKR